MKYFLFEKKDRIGILTINRPRALNALHRASLEELLRFLDTEIGRENICVLILTGAGGKAFIAGADIKEMNQLSPVQMLEFLDLGQRITVLLERPDLISIAAVNGYALGGGLEIALACDLIYASTTAKLGLPEVTLGIIPGFGGTRRLSRAIGNRGAKEMIFSGQAISADEAKEVGLVNKVVAPKQLLPEAVKMAEKIVRNSLFAVFEAKRTIQGGANMALLEALELEKQACALSFATEDRRERMDAFRQKRIPQFKVR